jgi:hypothetical protein
MLNLSTISVYFGLSFLLLSSPLAQAFGPDLEFSGKLALTGGVSEIEGSAGGGLTPWALIAGDETSDQIGASAYGTVIGTQKFNFVSKGFAIGLFDRVELSYARLTINIRDVGVLLGRGPDFVLPENIYGLKVRILGDAVKDQDTWIPQIAAGLQWKRGGNGAVPLSIGASEADGLDAYIAMTKLILSQSLLVDVTVRDTKANQLGLLGFGGNGGPKNQIELEASLGYLLTPHLVLGGEYRHKPNNINNIGALILEEDSFKDLFVAWAPTKNLSLTLAYVWMGNVATAADQNGSYLSAQVSF